MKHFHIQKLHGWLLPLLILTWAGLGSGCQTNTFTHKHFPERVAQIHTVALLPQVHTAMLNTYYGTEHSPAPLPEEPQIRAELLTATTNLLQQRGFVVKEGSFPDGTNYIWNGQMTYGTFPKPNPRTLPGAKALASNQNVDGLIFLYADAFKSTPHRQNITAAGNTLAVFVFLASIATAHPAGSMGIPMQGAQAQIALVDGKTGDVLWTTMNNFSNFETNRPAKAVNDLFSRYPKPKK